MPTVYRAACSDALSLEAHERWAGAEGWLTTRGESLALLAPGVGPWDDPDWWLVADPTGGSMAKDSLPVLVGGIPQGRSHGQERRAWWSMSDNTLVLNALVDRGPCRLLHGQPLTLSGKDFEVQRLRFDLWARAVRSGAPFPPEALPEALPLRGPIPLSCALVGGNLTALERLGDTPWRPRPRGRVLLVESLSCSAAQAAHRVATLFDDPWWADVEGLALGRFTHADRDDPSWVDRCLSLLPPDLSVFRLPQVGHGSDAWTVPLAEEISFSR